MYTYSGKHRLPPFLFRFVEIETALGGARHPFAVTLFVSFRQEKAPDVRSEHPARLAENSLFIPVALYNCSGGWV